jgi:hypothetical protein
MSYSSFSYRLFPNIVLASALGLLGCKSDAAPNEATSTVRSALGAPSVSLACSDTPCAASSTMTVSFANLAGTPLEWVAITYANAPTGILEAYKATSGGASGAVPFPSFRPDPGMYVARAFGGADGYALLAESAPFRAGTTPPNAPAITTACSESPCLGSSTITASFTNLPGTPDDWIAITYWPDSPTTSDFAYAYTGGAVSGSSKFSNMNLRDGMYVARAFTKNWYQVVAESAPFAIGSGAPPTVSITCSDDPCLRGSTITATYANLPPVATLGIQVAPPWASVNGYVNWVPTNGQSSGTATFTKFSVEEPLIARVYDNVFPTLDSTNRITAHGAHPSLAAACAPACTTETPVVASFVDLQGYTQDWIAAIPEGAPDTQRATWKFTNGVVTGSVTLGTLPPGSYVLKAYENGNNVTKVISAPFNVAVAPQPPPSNAALCAEVVLRPGSIENDLRDVAVAPGRVPVVSVVPRTNRLARTELSVRDCGGATSPSIIGLSADNVADASALGAALGSLACAELTGRAYIGTSLLGAQRVLLRRGPYGVTGNVKNPDGSPAARAAVLVKLGAESLSAQTGVDGTFTMSGLAAGTLALAQARSRAADGSPLEARIGPHQSLGPANPLVQLTLALAPAPKTYDAFEPDDTIAQAQHRAPITVGTRESHSLAPNDIDIAPIQLAAGQAIQIRALASGPGIDAALRVLSSAGTELARANGPSDPFQSIPTLAFTAPAAGAYAIVVTRNDGEASALAYDLVVAPVLH